MMRKRIAVLVAGIDREYQRDFAGELAALGAEMGVDVCIFNSQGHPNFGAFAGYPEDSVIYDLPDLDAFDGVISMTATMGSALVAESLRSMLAGLGGKPHVSIDVPMEGAVTLLFDDAISVEALVEHMIAQHGARSFAYVSGSLDSDVARDRLEACRRALKRRGLELADDRVFDGEWTRAGGKDAAQRLLDAGGPLPDVVLCGNDDMAISVIERFAGHGIRVPEDVAVTGFDALNEAVSRGVTTISRPIVRAARVSMSLLRDWMAGRAPRGATRLLPTYPVYGDSCGCHQDPERMNRKLRSLLSAGCENEAMLSRASMFFSRLTCVGDEDEAREAMREFTAGWGIRELYLCVDPAICRGNEVDKSLYPGSADGYPPDMLLLYGVRDGVEYPPALFRTEELLPEAWLSRDRAATLVFCPLYYRGCSFGYVALELGTGTGPALYSILMLLSGTLTSLYLQANLRKSAAMFDMTIHDVMTGLLNRRGYLEQAPAVLERAREEGRLFAVISADMDHLKDINDAHGHPAGDEAIRRMGACLAVLEDIGVTPVHISGDEFVAFGVVDDMAQARDLLARIRGAVERQNRQDPWICELSASLGVYAAVPKPGEEIGDFLARADRAMYADKNRKKSR